MNTHSNRSQYQNGDSGQLKNGNASESGSKKSKQKLSRQDKDIVRLIGQFLRGKGLEQSADALVHETGLALEHPVAARLRQSILTADWKQAQSDLLDLSKLLRQEDRSITEMKFLILEQKYLELLEESKVLEAVSCLRHEITPLKHNIQRVHQLSIYMMCNGKTDLREASNWSGSGTQSRQALIDKLQDFLPANVMLPPKRLESLLKQSIEHQINGCQFHNSTMDITVDYSLLIDHVCSRASFPATNLYTLTQHRDQVWFCKFSPDGTMLASGCKDGVVIIWSVNLITGELTVRHRINSPLQGVAYITWSPDNRYVLTCGPDDSSAEVFIYVAQTGDVKCKISQRGEDALTTAAFHADSSRVICAGARGQFYQCDLDGVVTDQWEGIRVHGVACRNDNRTVLAIDSHHRLREYDFGELLDNHILQEDHPIVSFSLSQDSRYALLNVSQEGIHIWDLKDQCLVNRLQGLKQGVYNIYSCFGGVNEDFVVSGSEDNYVYIWHRTHSSPIVQLEGHSQTVNCVHWNPANPTMIASASDDCTIKIWGPEPSNNQSSSSSASVFPSRGDSLSLISGRSTPV